MRVVLYARVSTEKQEQQQTIRSQIAALEEYAKQQGYEIVDRYIDDGWTGSVLARPALDRLRDDASRRLFDGVLIHSPDRLARTYVHQELLIEELKNAGSHIVLLNRPLADTPEDRMLQGMQGLFAEYEKAKIAERFRRGKLHKARSGRIVGHMAPYGYRYVKDQQQTREGRYVVDQVEAEVVRFIFKVFVEQQLSLGQLVKVLHKTGSAPRKAGEHWQRSSLNRILRNETYIGKTFYNKGRSVEPVSRHRTAKYHRVQRTSRRTRPKTEWIMIPVPAIISQDLFQRAQRQLVRNAELSPRRTKHQYLLRGLTRCGQCGCLYAGIPCHGKRQYRCRNKERRFPLSKSCGARMISAHILEPLVWSAVEEAINNPTVILRQFAKLGAKIKRNAELTEAERQRVDAALATFAAEEERLLAAYRAVVITLDQLRSQMAQIDSKRKTLINERNELHDRAKLLKSCPIVQSAEAQIQHYAHFIRSRTHSLTFEERQKFLRSFVSEITLFDDTIRIKGHIPIDRHSKKTETRVVLCANNMDDRDTVQRPDVPLRPHDMDNMDTKEHLEFLIVRELKHGKARPRKTQTAVSKGP